MATTTGTTPPALVPTLLGREDYALISSMVPEGARVLDVGCGEGELLHWLVENKNVQGRGIELQSERVHRAIARGLSVYQGDLNEGLHAYPDQAFDVVILSRTLQETKDPLRVLEEMLRIGKKVVVTFPNFAFWQVRLSLLFRGRAPQTSVLPYSWYDSPNIRVLSISDFQAMVKQQGWRIERELFLTGHRHVNRFANLLAEVAICQVSK
jgi:methionine biosynthesis protein MetW